MEANKPASYYYDQHMQFTAESEQSRQYDTDVCRQAHVDMGKLIKYYVRKYLPHMMSYYDSAKKKKGGKRKYEKTDISYQILIAANGRVY